MSKENRGALPALSTKHMKETENPLTRKQYKRAECEVKISNDFNSERNQTFSRQYAHLYFYRHSKLRPFIEQQARRKWGNQICIAPQILDLPAGPEECVIVGTIYKKMRYKYRILDEYDTRREEQLAEINGMEVRCADSDVLIFEDIGGRIDIKGLDPKQFSTGILLGIKGKDLEGNGIIDVSDYVVAGIAETIPFPVSSGEPKYVAIMSGLSFGESASDESTVGLMLQYITGSLGGEQDNAFASRICHVIIAGNSIIKYDQDAENLSMKQRSADTSITKPLKTLETFLGELSRSVDVSLMSGETDPSDFVLPQQPMHHCLLPGLKGNRGFNPVSNPLAISIDGVSILGNSGQMAADFLRHTVGSNTIDFLEKTLDWRHMAPTAPDTLGCYPFNDKDPFIIENSPHIYFAGNQPTYEEKMIHGPAEGQSIKLISVPSFAQTQTFVLVNLSNLSCHPVHFEVRK